MAVPLIPSMRGPEPARRPDARASVLVVDDRAAKLLALEALLSGPEFDVVCVSSGADALRQLLDRDFAVVLLDVNMPDMDGLETAALIRQRPRSQHVPIIFMTAGSDETHALLGYSLGAVDYILTPVIPEVLRTKVKVFVDLFRKTQELRRQGEERVALAEERAARAAADERSHRAAFLAEAGKAMARSLDLASTVTTVLDLLVPDLGESAVIRLFVSADEKTPTDYRRGEPGAVGAGAGLDEAMARCARSLSVETVPAGDRSEIAGMACPLLARGAVLGAVAVARGKDAPPSDAATVSLLEELCGRAAIAIDNCLLFREIEQRDHRKDRFVAMLAHELRNPLAALTSALGVLDTVGEREETAVRARHVIGRQIRNLAQLVDDLLDVARLTIGRITLARSRVNLADSLGHCLGAFSGAGRTEGYTLDVDAVDTWVDADPTRLDQVLTNLIGNALKYTPGGGRIRVRVWPEDAMGVFEIEDSGIGMSPEVLAQAFELFFQADQTLDRAQGGLGIGLALVRQLVELHGGSVEAVSAGPSRGSRFTVRFPRADASATPQPGDAISGVHPDSSRIVIVEDNRDSREMLRVLLDLGGHQVYEAEDGPGAVEVIRATEPDIALIDVGLPGCDGYEVARRVRSIDGLDRVFLVALTGYSQPEDKAQAIASGFDMHVVKPVDQHHLTSVIAAARDRKGNSNARA